MLTNGFYLELASLVAGTGPPGGNLFIAIGEGNPAWDGTLPSFSRETSALVRELARRAVDPADISFLDDGGQVSARPTTRLRVTTTFDRGDGSGTLREVGLYGGAAGPAADSGTLLSHVVHPRLEKTPTMALARSLQLDLTPRASGPGLVETQYVGNSYSREFHDLGNESGSCQIGEIRPDRRIYFAGPEQAVGTGYDFCAFCFPRELSRR